MKDHAKKKIAPIVITAVMLVYFILYFGLLIRLIPFTVLKILCGLVPLLLGGAMIYVCIQRIKEINGGEEDDLGKY